MGTVVARPARVRNSHAEEKFVEDLVKLSRRALAGVAPAEREKRLAKLNAYLDGLDDENVSKQA